MKSGKRKTEHLLFYIRELLNKGRGLKESILAITELEEKVVFKIAGEGDLSNELRMFAKEVATEGRIHFLGWLSPEQFEERNAKC